MTDDDTTRKRWIATDSHGYGQAFSEYDAVTAWAANVATDARESGETQLTVAQVSGEARILPNRVDAQTVHQARSYTMGPEALDAAVEAAEKAGDAELATERALVASDESDPETGEVNTRTHTVGDE